MRLVELQLNHFRNYEELFLEFGKGVHIFIGENAQGKTNLMESIYTLAMTKSHRTNQDRELIMWNQDAATIKGKVEKKISSIPLEIRFSNKGKIGRVNHLEQKKLSSYLGQLNVILFAPENLELVKGAPANRRKFMDMELGQMNPIYLHELVEYQRLIKQRNHYLKQLAIKKSSADLYLEVLTEQVIEKASAILIHRLEFMEQLEALARPIHEQISLGREEFSLKYQTSLSIEKGISQDEVKEGEVSNYTVHQSKEFGRYIDVNDFGADPTGKKDSLAAIKAALTAAHKEKAMLFMDGTYYISDQIVINGNNSGVKGIFGSGMGKTLITFDKAQVGVFNPNTNHDDIRAFAGILVDGQSHKTIANLSVKYTNPDFYRKGLSYFGKVSGILVNDADHTLISKVEVSGVNRAGVMFTSTDALVREAGKSQTYKARVQSGEINEQYDQLPLGENNRIVDSYLHHNRVAGAMVGYQKNFVGEGNRLEWNGHEADGGTGYGMTAMAGSYNYGITFRNNTTDHNYRKGLDVHDGTGIVIENNVLNGDRLYGIAAYNRQFSMDNVKIKDNVITQDPNFRLYMDDDLGRYYHMYSGIQVQTNTQLRDLHTADKGYYDISGNTIKNLAVYQNHIQTYGIEFRNHENKMDYTLNITDNKIDGESTKYLMAVINNTYDHVSKHDGIGTGTINISDNTANIGKIAPGAVPFYFEEHRSDVPLHGSITLNNNNITVREESAGYREFAYMRTNAKEYNVTNNTLSLHGKLNDAIVDVNSTGDGVGKATLNVANNTLHTDIKGKLYATWLKHEADVDTFAGSNTHNGDQLKDVNTTGKDIALSDVLGHVHNKVEAIHDTVYANHPKYPTMIDDQTYHNGIL